MRNEKEMLTTILVLANQNPLIRAVYMNGSRTNPNAPKDIYQDYDIVFVVTEIAPLVADQSWLAPLGKPLLMQKPDWNDLQTDLAKPTECPWRYTWLMLFEDGNRVDLTLLTKEKAIAHYLADSLTLPLFDKDHLLPALLPPRDNDYHIKPPREGEFIACCNEFWWCLNNVAKGIARDELPYALTMLNTIVRTSLDQMTEWFIGLHHQFSLSAGKMGKYYKTYLPAHLYKQYCATYCPCNTPALWQGVFTMCDLFHSLAITVANHFVYAYNHQEEEGAREYLYKVKENRYQ